LDLFFDGFSFFAPIVILLIMKVAPEGGGAGVNPRAICAGNWRRASLAVLNVLQSRALPVALSGKLDGYKEIKLSRFFFFQL
jgi:hypothetical protein